MLFDYIAGLRLESEIAGEARTGPAGFHGCQGSGVAMAEAFVDPRVGPGLPPRRLAVVQGEHALYLGRGREAGIGEGGLVIAAIGGEAEPGAADGRTHRAVRARHVVE